MLTPQDVNPTQISLKVPAHLSAGVQGVQILHLSIDTPDVIIESNLAAFVLHPEITATVTNVQTGDNDLRSVDIVVQFSPKVTPLQQVILLLNEVSKPRFIAYSFAAIPVSGDTDLLTFNVTNIIAGTYLVRVRVDGAESPLQVDRFGKYDGKQVVIP